MSGLAKGAGSVPLNDVSDQAVESLLRSADWQKRLAEARVQREKVLAERALQGGARQSLTAPKKPWEREAVPRVHGVAKRSADPVAEAATRASLLMPSVMRATRPEVSVAPKPAAAEVVPARPLLLVRYVAPAALLKQARDRATETTAKASEPDAPVTSAPAFASSRALTVTVQPLVAPERGRARSLALAVGVAFAAGLGLGGGLLLWLTPFGAPTTPVSPGLTSGPHVAVVAESAVLPAQPMDGTPETALPADLPGAPAASPAVKIAAALDAPAAADSGTVVLRAPVIASADPAATPAFSIGEMSDVVVPRVDGDSLPVTSPEAIILWGVAEDAAPAGIAPPARPQDVTSALLSALGVPITGEVLSYAPSSSPPGPMRSELPGLSLPDLAFARRSSTIRPDSAFADPGTIASAAPPPAPRVLAGAAFPSVAVRLFSSPRASRDAADTAARALRDDGFVLSASKPIVHKINQSHVRYYFPQDQAAAEAIAATLGVGARAVAPPTSATVAGTVEVWLGGQAPASAMATSGGTSVTKTKVKAAKAVGKARKNTSSAAARRKAELKQLQILRDRIIRQLRAGVRP